MSSKRREPREHGLEWQKSGATLSDKSAMKEYGLTKEEIYQAIRARKLQFREASMHGSPWFRLLRREVEGLVKQKHGKDFLSEQVRKTEVTEIDKELRTLKRQIRILEKRRATLISDGI